MNKGKMSGLILTSTFFASVASTVNANCQLTDLSKENNGYASRQISSYYKNHLPTKESLLEDIETVNNNNKENNVYVLHQIPADYKKGETHNLPTEESLLKDIEAVNNIVKKEPALVKIKGKTIVIGDLHTNPNAARYIKDFCEPKIKEGYTVIFLGDVIDRGQQAKSFDDTFETFETVLKLKISHPKNVFYLRGNHETKNTNKRYGFLENTQKKYRTTKVWEKANEMFSNLPLCVVRESEKNDTKTFMVHGSIPTPNTCNNYKDFIQNLNAINNKQKYCDKTKSSMVFQMLWNDYKGNKSTELSPRDGKSGTIFVIGKKDIDLFRKNTEIVNIISGHAHVNDNPDSNYTRIVTSPNMKCDNGPGYIMELKD